MLSDLHKIIPLSDKTKNPFLTTLFCPFTFMVAYYDLHMVPETLLYSDIQLIKWDNCERTINF